MNCRTRIPLNDERYQYLLKERGRTGVAAQRLLHGRRNELPRGLTSNKLNGWFHRLFKTIDKPHWDYVVNLYQELPDNGYFVPTEKQLKEFQKLYSKAKGRVSIILRDPNKPEGLTEGLVRRFASGRTKKIRRGYFDYLMRVL